MADDPEATSLVPRAAVLAAQVLVPAGLLTSLLFFVGYVHLGAYYGFFGVDLAVLGLATTDYVTLSANALFPTVAALLLIALVALLGHHVLRTRLADADPVQRRRTALALLGVASALLAVGILGLPQLGAVVQPRLAAPALGLGALLLEYAVPLPPADGVPRRPRPAAGRDPIHPLRRFLLGSVAVLAVFWFTHDTAHSRGVDAARALAVSLVVQDQAVLYSERPLQISGRGVQVAELDSPESPFQYRYRGLVVLLYSDDRWFLLPRGWTRRSGDPVVLVHDDRDTLRVDLVHVQVPR